jgi:hypothetical protein
MICPEIAKIEMPNASGGFVKANKKTPLELWPEAQIRHSIKSP